MTTYITQVFRRRFEANHRDADMFIDCFSEWKAGEPLDNLLFGKDVPYRTPTVGGKHFSLRHVHLIPQANAQEAAEWRDAYNLGRQKTSDRALVYVSDDKGNHLLLGILEEPEAHEIARMKTPEHESLMRTYATIAEEFLQTGKTSA
ncbi:type II toxin-antitoxin system YafO family toxin [Oxalobacteraceae bacterium]|nr:type II toxin-antitoxin system YafO family toxin [Oxalobacteraceae bacterium]